MSMICAIHVFDPTSKMLDAWKFDAVGLSHQEETLHHAGKTFPSKPLSSLMRHRNHSFIDILKVDIDGFECNIPATRLALQLHLLSHYSQTQIHLPMWRRAIGRPPQRRSVSPQAPNPDPYPNPVRA